MCLEQLSVTCGDPRHYLKLVRNHMPEALVVDRPNEDVCPESLTSVATYHGFTCNIACHNRVSQLVRLHRPVLTTSAGGFAASL